MIGGGVILVVATIGMSLVQTDFLEQSHGEKRNEELISSLLDGDVEISILKEDIGEQLKVLNDLTLQKDRAEEIETVAGELHQLVRSNADLRLTLSEAEEAVVQAENLRKAYRSQMREWLWPQFANRPLENEDLVTRISYKDARIIRVDAAGLLVRHQSGVARIEVASLSPVFRGKLDLSISEAKQVMMEMMAQDLKLKKRRVKKEGEPSPADVETLLAKKLAKGKEKAFKLSDLISKADSAAADARYQERTSKNRSAPASLETWGARAARFERAALKYRNQLAEALIAVREMEPNFSVPGR